MKSKIWLSSPHMSGNEMNFIRDAFDTNWIAPLGPNVNAFESELADYLKINQTAAVCSGTAAIHLALILMGVNSGDEILASSFTFSATINPIVYQGATPIFIDSEEETWNMSPELLEYAIQDRLKKGKKPKAIIVVHLYGMPAKMNAILAIAEKYDIPIIEDAAEALGSKYNGKACGTFGKIGILSFNGNKIITTSGGGAILSNNPEYIKRAKFFATQSRDEAPYYQHSQIGYNYRLSNVLAGIGRGQLSVIEDRISKRRSNFDYYCKELRSIKWIEFLNEKETHFSNRWLTTILINPESRITRDNLLQFLNKENIETRPLWKPMHLQPIFSKYPGYINGISEKLFDKGLCLPSGSNLSNEDLQRVTSKIIEAFEGKI